MKSQPTSIVLSICIPSYKRGAFLANRIKHWLAKTRRADFEIIVADNASKDGSVEILSTINDNRFSLIINDTNVGGFENGLKTFGSARGKYFMILTDKDTLAFEHCDEILNTLKKIDVACGLIVPDTKSFTQIKITEGKDRILFKHGLRYAHPSGHFYRTDLIKSGHIFTSLRMMPENIRPFSTDFQISLFANHGSFAQIEIPFVRLIAPPFEGIAKSATYTNPSSAFFMPQAHFDVLCIYIKLLHSLRQGLLLRLLTIFKHAGLLFAFSTSTYLYLLKQDNLCEWYGLSPAFRSNEMRRPLIREYYRRIFGAKCLSLSDKLSLAFGGLCCLPLAFLFKLRISREVDP